VTREQIIVLGFIAAAFLAGWVARALIGLAARRRADRHALLDERLEGSFDERRRELDRALQAYHGTVARALGGRDAVDADEAGPATDVGEALRSDAANQAMQAGISPDRDAELTDLELDLTDWGFAYGVAWAAARERDPDAPEEVIAREALGVAETVFRDYTDGVDWTERLGDRRRNGRAGSLGLFK
jgi:hypothetical protein